VNWRAHRTDLVASITGRKITQVHDRTLLTQSRGSVKVGPEKVKGKRAAKERSGGGLGLTQHLEGDAKEKAWKGRENT